MNVSAITVNNDSGKNMFIKYANHFMSFKSDEENIGSSVNQPQDISDKKISKVKGIETLTIFPKQVIEGKTIFTA